MRSFLCIGGAHLDIKLTGRTQLIRETSNPVYSAKTPGGVARNIAENLARLRANSDQFKISLISRVGRDSLGTLVIDSVRELGVQVDFMQYSDRHPTATYTALIEPNGELHIAAADMAIYDEVGVNDVDAAAGMIWIADSNLPEATLLSLAQKKQILRSELWIVPVSVAKARRLQPILHQMDGVIMNFSEFCEVSGLADQTSNHDSIETIFKKFCQTHSKHIPPRIVMTCGARGLAFWNKQKCFWVQFNSAAVQGQCQDVTGAGDAFASGLIWGINQGHSFEEAVLDGLATAQITLRSLRTVHPELCSQKLKEQKNAIRFSLEEIK